MTTEAFQRTLPATLLALLIAIVSQVIVLAISKLAFFAFFDSSNTFLYTVFLHVIPISVGVVLSLRITTLIFGKANIKRVFYAVFCVIFFLQTAAIALSQRVSGISQDDVFILGHLITIVTAYVVGRIVLGQIRPGPDYPRDNPFERHLKKE
jgi:hypothetical protein